MRWRRPVVLFALLSVTVPQVAGAGVRTTSSWVEVRSGDLRASGNGDHARLDAALERVRRSWRVLAQLMPLTGAHRPRIHIVVDCTDTNRPRAAFVPGRAVSFARLACRDDGLDQDAVEHIARHVVQRSYDQPPLWLAAGVARYVAASRESGRGVEVRWPTAPDIVQLRAPWLPIRSVLSADEASAEWTDASLRPRFVAQAAAYVAFAVATRPGGDFAAIVTRRAELGPEGALRHALGDDLDVFGAKAERYVRDGVASSAHFPAGEPAPQPSRRQLTAAEAAAVSVHVLAEEGRLREGRDRAMRALAAAPDAPGLLVAFARVTAMRGEKADAVAACHRAVAAADMGDLDRYYCASIVLGPSAYGADLTRVDRQDAEAALRLLADLGPERPADAHYLEGVARLRIGDAGGAASSAQQALARWPEHRFALLAAEAYVELAYVAAAAAILRDLAETSRDDAVRAAAAHRLAELGQDARDARRPIPVLRRLGATEGTATGRLIRIDCGEPWTTLRIAAAEQVSTFVLTRLELLDIRHYGVVVPEPVRCGDRPAREVVRVTWRPDAAVPTDAIGIAVALEFVPEPAGR